jgi:PncC family amidohydrolase
LDEPFEVTLGKLLARRSWCLAVAESCTGGLLGHRVTNVPGSSEYFLGGVIAYANQAKTHVLGVRQETLDQFGAVSRETVLEMARGVQQTLGADVGLSISGIAGPGGGTPEKPVGTVWMALHASHTEQAWCYHFTGNRLHVKEQAVQQALQNLIEFLGAS